TSILITQERLLQGIRRPLITLGGVKGVLNYLNAQLPGANLCIGPHRQFIQDPLPPAIGDSYVFSYDRWINKREVSYPSKSKVGRNLRPPCSYRVLLPAFKKDLYREHIVTALRSASEVDVYRKDNEITVAGRDVPKPILSFDETDFPDCVTKVLRAQGLGSSPTGMQAQGWPVVLSGRDLLAVVPGSSEKFLAYVVPAVLHVLNQDPVPLGDGPIVLVLASTRELARQAQQAFCRFNKDSGVRTACLVPGEPKETQLKQLDEGCEVWVATPGRLVALMEECKVENEEACQLADEFMEDYVTVSVGEIGQQSQNRRAEHIVYVCDEVDKEDRLVALFEDILDDKRDKAVVFVETKGKVDDLVSSLRLRDWPAVGIHSKKTEQEREWALNALRFGRMLVLVATDVVACDLDADGVRFVVNYDSPRSSDEYALRVKHAVRDDGIGRAYTFLKPSQHRNAKELISILRDAGQEVPQELLKVANKMAWF
ncbi:hypothetical protein MTO96_041793, partial [Rhipicephalus appendiculatus]